MKKQIGFEVHELPQNPAARFRELGEHYVATLAKLGFKKDLSRTRDLDHFHAASPKRQLIALNFLEFNTSLLDEMIALGEDPRETKRFLWRALQKLKMTPPSDMMDYIDDEDIVEVYLKNEIQIFRNIRFMEVTSLTIEELLTLPWYHMGSRPWRHMLLMFRFVLRFKTGLIRRPTPWNIPEHIVTEFSDEERNRFSIRLKNFIPLSSMGRVVAAVSTNESFPVR